MGGGGGGRGVWAFGVRGGGGRVCGVGEGVLLGWVGVLWRVRVGRPAPWGVLRGGGGVSGCGGVGGGPDTEGRGGVVAWGGGVARVGGGGGGGGGGLFFCLGGVLAGWGEQNNNFRCWLPRAKGEI